MARLNIKRQEDLEPKRMSFAKEQITKLGYEILFESETEVNFEYMGHTVHFFPYSGWHSGSTIRDGRGLSKLLRQIKKG